jgi:hypothetical protein
MVLKLTFTLLCTTFLAACASKAPAPETAPAPAVARAAGPAAQAAPEKEVLIEGKFRCEQGKRVVVRIDPKRADAIKLDWKGRSYPLRAVTTSSGSLRYEDAASGHVWIQFQSKSMLLNGKAGRQLASDCKTV